MFIFLFLCKNVLAQFAPPAGQIGSTALHKDSGNFISWANNCVVNRGFQDISDTTLGLSNVGTTTSPIGIADGLNVLSLGDGGSAILTFPNPIKNGIGWDFAVFENAFIDTYLELAFVEVSSDGINFFRFPATSNTQDTMQIGSFGAVDATKINNLAGKYVALYGTPFDLEEMKNIQGLDVDFITHIKIIDVVGCIQESFARYDKNGNKINDIWNTPFGSSGFDLDAIGVIHQQPLNFINNEDEKIVSVYPNPTNNFIFIENKTENIKEIFVYDIFGNKLKTKFEIENNRLKIDLSNESNGIYFLHIKTASTVLIKKIIKE
ncbi:MAG: T9SS type A sorting domain-containing protein [Chitinophagaceae bacterium]|nr:T9SS type A sorting domain-containing protein [Chitinophagaceae bacterium]